MRSTANRRQGAGEPDTRHPARPAGGLGIRQGARRLTIAANLPVAFAALLAGGLLLEKGVAAAKDAFAGGTAQAATSGSGDLGSASGKLNASQRTFASELASKTGLDPKVVAAWLLAEEPASATHAPNGPHNWLNIGSTDAGFHGAANPAWQDPTKAADFSAQWLAGTAAPGFGTASAGIRSILSAAGKDAQAQIRAIQHSGWASSGYPNLPTIYGGL